MVQVVTREAVQDLLSAGRAQLVEVLPREQYDWAHLPSAVNHPMRDLNDMSAATLDRSRPIIVYCHDWLCDLSPRAAHRLERLGFDSVHDYSPGKMDWISADLPYEGHAALVREQVRRDPVIAYLEDPLVEVADRVIADPAGLAVVIDRDDVVHGVIGSLELIGADPTATAERVMRVGVTTTRPSTEVARLAEHMDHAKIRHVVVTRADGTLVGLFGVGDLRAPESEPDLG
ncbi:rhodanese-like domain-containing protein [Microbispora sp. H13382]|uniref:rhodanese-like domain-containing protein n=1 Tax=Microbispora sp. H13382 TaxID=2729112 RepID=UPI001601F4BF|nr:rhodanese-like domain-containing protein [Microbispora sp. H13382]